jgi:hypothetical protein
VNPPSEMEEFDWFSEVWRSIRLHWDAKVIINEDDDPPSDFAISFLYSDSFRAEADGWPNEMHLTDSSFGSHCYMPERTEHFIPLSLANLTSRLAWKIVFIFRSEYWSGR